MGGNCNVYSVSRVCRSGLLSCVCLAIGFMLQGSDPADAGRFKQTFLKKSNSFLSVKKPYKIRKKRRTRRATRKYKRRRQIVSKPVPPLVHGVDENEPVQILVSLPTQTMTVYKGGVEIATSRVSSGKPGHTTPSGVFSILQKKRVHYSNLYDNAPMPYMQRLTWSGVALHAGKVPNYPASHGCIRMPQEFAHQLFGVTNKGAHVLVAADDAILDQFEHTKLFRPAPLATIFDPAYLIAVKTAKDEPSRIDEPDAVSDFKGTQRRLVSTAGVEAYQPMNAAWALADPYPMMVDTRLEDLHVYEGRRDEPIRILITRRTARERNFDVQKMLNKLGLEVGAPDGQVGRLTRSAIKNFQRQNGLPVTGTVTDELFRQLAEASGTLKFTAGHLYVRQGYKDLFDAPVTINDASSPLGTHVYTAMHFGTDATRARWTAVTLKQSETPQITELASQDGALAAANAVSPAEALDRIEIPDHLRRRIEAILTPGSSLIVSDNGIDTRETNKGTDFIVRTW